MSQDHLSHDHDDIPRFEPWLGVMAGSLVPAAVALLLPHSFAIPLIVCTALLFATSLMMLAISSRRRARERRRVEPPSPRADSSSARDSVAAEAE